VKEISMSPFNRNETLRAPVEFFLVVILLLLLPVEESAGQTDLSPERWGEEELKKYVRTKRIAEPIFTSGSAMVTGTSSSIAIRAGLEALRQGGSAIDSALTVALTHTTLAGGCTVSFAGILTVVYYDAASGEVFALDAGYNTVKGEKDPLTIPRSSRSDPSQGSGAIPKGRTVLVPGFVAGLEAAHARFGTLPFAELFKPAIYFAEKGFPISPVLARYADQYREILSRVPATREVFTKKDGSLYGAGEIWRQPALARTLKRIAEEGTEYFYRGAWAEKLVAAVQRDGGRMTLDDMRRYRAIWDDPIRADYGGTVVWLPRGGINLAGMINLLELSDLPACGYYGESPESFYRFCRIISAVNFGTGLAGMNYRQEDWIKKEFAAKAWERLRRGTPSAKDRSGGRDGGDGDEEKPRRRSGAPSHSDAVVVVDGAGNVAALLHSSNTISFGESGLYIDGVSIPDSATFQQALLAVTEPGERLFNPTVPLVVTRDGRPVLGVSAIGSGIYEETIKCLVNILGFGRGMQEAIDAPGFVPFFGGGVDTPSTAIAVAEGAFPEGVLEEAREMGISIEALPPAQARRRRGAAIGILIDGKSGTREAGSVRGFALGFSEETEEAAESNRE
jgi:gamma-glutamyltranspeptidase / glutathione hydrolase